MRHLIKRKGTVCQAHHERQAPERRAPEACSLNRKIRLGKKWQPICAEGGEHLRQRALQRRFQSLVKMV